MEHYLIMLLRTSWQGGALILLVLAAQWVFGRRLHPRWRYGLWLLVMLRLALPGAIQSPVSLFNLLHLPAISGSLWGDRSGPEIQSSAVVSQGTPTELGSELQRLQREVPPWGRLGGGLSLWAGVWAGGCGALALCVLAAHNRLWRRVARQRPLLEPRVIALLQECKEKMGVPVPVNVIETEAVGTPSLFGFWRQRLLLPAGMTRSFSLEELRYVFLHELGHIKRHDILLAWLMTALQILHWFNPLVWLAFRRMRTDRELACDALALSYAREGENQQYGGTILKLLGNFSRPGWAPGLAGAVENRNQLKERIRMIAQFKRTKRRPLMALALFTSLGLLTLTDGRSGTAQSGKDLAGAWILVGEPNHLGVPPAAGGRIKAFTNHTWSVTQADPGTGATIFNHGGTYELKGNEYTEHVEHANEGSKELKGQAFKFTLKIEDDTLTQTGIGNPWTEVWKRVKAGAVKPAIIEPTALQGTWRGKEVGGRDGGIAKIVIQGSTLQAGGADTNEWYKASLTLFDTTPKQMVLVIKECPFPQYVGQTACAIYELKNGELTITGNEPGFLAAPTNFDAPHARKFVCKKE